MGDTRLLIVAVVAAGIGLCCTVVPGVIAWLKAFLTRQPRPAILGPLFWHDLVKLARRGQQLRLRPAFTAVLLGGLFVTYLESFRDENAIQLVSGIETKYPIDRMSAFGERFLTIYLYCQLAAVVLVTPVIAGGAVTEDRDRGTLDHLRTSLLTSRELVASYLTARLVYIFGVMLTGLPVLALTFMFGGVDPGVLIAGTTIAAMTALSLGSFALYLGLTKPALRQVLFWCYGLMFGVSVFGLMCCCLPPVSILSPFNATYLIQNGWNSVRPTSWDVGIVGTTAAFVGVHGTMALLFTWRSIAHVRTIAPVWRESLGRAPGLGRFEGEPQSTRPNVIYQDTNPRARARPPLREFAVPRLGASDPLVWKERFFSGRLGGTERGLATGCGAVFVGLIVLPVGLTLFVAVALHIERGSDVSATFNPLLRWCAVLATTVLAPLAGFWAVSCVTRERERMTLDALFTLPVTREELLTAKWKAAAMLLRYWLYALGALAVLSVVTGSVNPFGLFAATIVVLGFCVFATTLAVWLSVRCRTTTRAASWYVGLLLVVSILPFPIATLAGSACDLLWPHHASNRSLAESAIKAACVPYSTYHALFQWGSVGDAVDKGLISAVGAGVSGITYSAIAYFLWRNAVRRFETEGR